MFSLLAFETYLNLCKVFWFWFDWGLGIILGLRIILILELVLEFVVVVCGMVMVFQSRRLHLTTVTFLWPEQRCQILCIFCYFRLAWGAMPPTWMLQKVIGNVTRKQLIHLHARCPRSSTISPVFVCASLFRIMLPLLV